MTESPPPQATQDETPSLKDKVRLALQTDPIETLAAFKTFSILSPMDISSMHLSHITDRARLFKDTEANVRPELDAILFYLYSQVVHSLERVYPQYAPLPVPHAEVLYGYRLFATKACLRSLYYLTVVCARESRHSKEGVQAMTNHLMYNGADPDVATSFSAFFKQIKGQNYMTAMERFLTDPPDLPYYDFVQCLCYAFSTKFEKSYGGDAWEAIATTLRKGITGVTSMTTMLDTSFTLAHNTGPIFNKGVYYRHQDNGTLLFVLDLQRAGALPEGLRSGALSLKSIDGYSAVTDQINGLLDVFYSLNPDHPVKVDYERMVSLGAVGDYSMHLTAVPPSPPAWAVCTSLPTFNYTGATLPLNPMKQPVNELQRCSA